MKSPACDVAYLADWIASATDGFRFCHRWIPCIPAREVKHVCVFVHGLGDHGGRFDELGRFLSSQGVAVQAIDLIGHGRSPGRRGRIKSYEGLLDEIAWSIQEARQVWRNANVTLIGHSMGGNLALTYSAKRVPSEHDSAPKSILPFRVDATPQRIIAVAPMLRPFGKPIREDFLNVGCQLAKWVPNWPMRMKTRPELLTRNRQKQQQYRSDSLVHRVMSIRLGIDLFMAGRALASAQFTSNLPALLIHGTGDRLADINGSRAFCERNPRAQLWELTDEHHDPFHSLQKDLVSQRILDYCRYGRLSLAPTRQAVLAA